MVGQAIYGIHSFSAIVFGILLLLPFFALRWKGKDGAQLEGALKFWRMEMHIAHLFVILSLVTGIILASSYTSTWFWLVIVVFLAMGALIGIVAKSLRLMTAAVGEKQSFEPHLRKLTRLSFILAGTIVVMLILMNNRW